MVVDNAEHAHAQTHEAHRKSGTELNEMSTKKQKNVEVDPNLVCVKRNLSMTILC